MNRGRLFASIEYVERSAQKRLIERPAPVQRSPEKPAAPATDRPRRILAANPTMQAAVVRLAAPPPKPAHKPRPKPKPKAKAKAKPLSPRVVRTRRKQRGLQVEDMLHERFPAAFPGRHLAAPPLAIGIHAKLRELDPAAFPHRALSRFMRYWTGRRVYLEALAAGAQRVNLDGSLAGSPTPEEMAKAADALAAQAK